MECETMMKISKRQQDILDFIKSEVKSKGYPPSVREIGAAVDLHPVPQFTVILLDLRAKDLSEGILPSLERLKY